MPLARQARDKGRGCFYEKTCGDPFFDVSVRNALPEAAKSRPAKVGFE